MIYADRNILFSRYDAENLEWRMEQLQQKHSNWMDDAMKAGMIRPFQLLITMTPMERVKLAGTLGFCLILEV